MLNISDEKKLEILGLNVSPGLVNIDGINYFVKDSVSNNFLNEIFAAKVAKIVGIKCSEYYYIDVFGNPFIASKNLNDVGDFKLGASFFANNINLKYKTSDSLYEIWDALSIYYKNTLIVESLMFQLVRIYIFDLLFMNGDRHCGNWGIINDESVYILDNEFFFSYLEYPFVTSYFDIGDSNENNLEMENIHFGELENFFKTSDERFIKELERMLLLVTPAKVYSLIKKTENEYITKFEDQQFINHYINLYDRVISLIKQNGVVRK